MLLLGVTIRELFRSYFLTAKFISLIVRDLSTFICVFPRKDSFTLSCATHLGRLNKIRIGHDNTGFGAAWFLDKASCLDIPDILGSFIY